MLVSNGAHAFAEKRGIQCLPPDSLVCERARSEWHTWKTRLDSIDSTASSSNDIKSAAKELHRMQDTVGAIAWDCNANIAAGVSRYVLYQRVYVLH